MYPIVVVRQPGQTPIHLSVREPIELGRECTGLLLADPQVSRRHLLIEPAPDGVMVVDMGSTNGTLLDDRPLRHPSRLESGSVVRLGETTVELVADRTVATAAGARGTMVAGTAPDPKATIARGAAEGAARRVTPVGGQTDSIRRTSIDAVAASAASDGVDVASLPVDQGTVTIVFSDIESSTDLNVAMGDQAWFDLLAIHNRIVADRVREFGGTIIKNAGDGFMMSFPGARRALDCMSAIQRDLLAHSTGSPDQAIKVRMGLHTGEVLADHDGDLFGTHVVVAARVANLAGGGEILVSALTREIIVSRGDITFEPPRDVTLKGIGDALVYPYAWHRA